MFRSRIAGVVMSMCLIRGMCLSADQPVQKPAGAKTSKSSESKNSQGLSRITSKVHVEPVATLTDRETNEVALCGSRILKHVVQARDALQHQNQSSASQHLEQASKLLAIIDGVLPRYKITTEIKSGEHTYIDEDEFTPQYITLFEELERRDILTPIAQAKQATNQKNANPDEADNEVPMAVTHADVDMSAIRMDLTLTRRMLAVADKLLDQRSSNFCRSVPAARIHGEIRAAAVPLP